MTSQYLISYQHLCRTRRDFVDAVEKPGLVCHLIFMLSYISVCLCLGLRNAGTEGYSTGLRLSHNVLGVIIDFAASCSS